MYEEVQFEQIDSSVTCFQGLYLTCLGVFLHALSMVFGVRKCPRLITWLFWATSISSNV